MSSLQNKRFCAGLTVLGMLLVKLSHWLLDGKLLLDPVESGLSVILIGCLAIGSNIARWIVAILAMVSAVIGLLFLQFHLHSGEDFVFLPSGVRLSLILMAIVTCIYGFVGWRLTFWSSKGRMEQESEESFLERNS